MTVEAKILAQRPFKEILAPVRQGFHESGMTDGELAALVEKAREDFHRERRAEDKMMSGDLARDSLESYSLDEYKSGRLTAHQAQELLGFETGMELTHF